MYQALYRKYRPRSFDDVVGQEHITTTLKNQAKRGALSHAYLFTGSRGTGKTTCSKILAKAANCPNLSDGNPCNQCDICQGIDDGSVLDVAEIDAASNNGVENIRQLREEAAFTPVQTKYRVFILDECHMLSAGAVNALLKLLEEPPAHVIFVLATTELHKVLPTILSRCQRFDFRRIQPEIIAKRLTDVCGQEQIPIAPEAASLIGRMADGGMRDALSMLDLCTAYADDITEDVVREALGLSDQAHIFAIFNGVLENDRAALLNMVAELSDKGADIPQLTAQLQEHLRSILLLKTLQHPETALALDSAQMKRLREQADKFSMPKLLSLMDIFSDTAARLPRSGAKRLELELALTRCCSDLVAPQQSDSHNIQPLLERIQRLEQTIAAGVRTPAPSSQAGTPSTNSAGAAGTPAAPTASPTRSGSDSDKKLPVTPEAQWPHILEALRSINPALHGAMLKSNGYRQGDRMLVECDNAFFLDMLRTSATAKESLRSAISRVTGQQFSLGPYDTSKYQVQKNDSAPVDALIEKAKELGIQTEIVE